MGWGRTLLLGDIGTQMNVSDLESELENARAYLEHCQRVNDSQEAAILALQKENNELKLYFSSLVKLLLSKNVMTADEWNRCVETIDPK